MQRIDLAYAELASSEVVRDINRDVVLELIRTRQPISRADLSRSTGLQPSTISSIAEQLIGERWVIEGPAAIRPRGRRPTLLSINPSMVIVVADVRPDQAIVGVVDLNGRFLQREALPLAADPERGVRNLITCIERLMPKHPDKSFEGLGIILPGRVDPSTEQLVLAPNLPWARYDIKKAIQSAIKLQVEMDNDANACLLAELWFGRMEGVRNAVLVTITEGVGAAILANGQLLTGRSGLAGEFGHLCLDPNGPICGCGRKGCWEVFASTRSAINHFLELRKQSGRPNSPVPSSFELINMAENGDPDAIAALNRQALYMGQGLRIIVTALSPEVVLLNGGLTSAWDRFGPIVEAELADSMLSGTPPRIIVTSDVELARLRGAAALVLQRHAGYSKSNASDGKPIRRPRNPKKTAA
ncbi:ROK family protein [Granulicella sp. 5B5]|nr:ROK family protein [Granulicella sp. 5B5]